VRDVTATVASRPLIVASILSKKLAAGVQHLVLDVKTGSGAFMVSQDAARDLAQALVTVATRAGCPTRAILSDMSQPLAPAAGNAVELRVALDLLRGNANAAPRLHQMVLALGSEALALAGIDGGRDRLDSALSSGAAAAHFARMVFALGGPADLLERPEAHLLSAPVVQPVVAPCAGRVAGFDTRALGQAVIGLGGGRRAATDRVDPRVGFSAIVPIGTPVAKGDPLAMVHAASPEAASRAAASYVSACRVEPTAQVPELVQMII
jgi:thymidine phosphorylase